MTMLKEKTYKLIPTQLKEVVGGWTKKDLTPEEREQYEVLVKELNLALYSGDLNWIWEVEEQLDILEELFFQKYD